jgi:hypothetical protein
MGHPDAETDAERVRRVREGDKETRRQGDRGTRRGGTGANDQ